MYEYKVYDTNAFILEIKYIIKKILNNQVKMNFNGIGTINYHLGEKFYLMQKTTHFMFIQYLTFKNNHKT